MGRSDSPLLDLGQLESFFRAVDRVPGPPVDLIVVGGAAVVLLCRDDGRETRDIDLVSSAGIEEARHVAARRIPAIDINDRAAMFEQYLREDWQASVRRVFEGRRLHVYAPCPEDLAVMKIFRFAAKDEDDLLRLAGITGFDRRRFLESFLAVLPGSVGDKRRDAQTFALTWNKLFPQDETLDTDEVLRRAGLS